MERLIQYIGNHPVLSGAAVVVAIAAIVIELRARATSFMAIGPQDVVRLMNQHALVLDLRPAEAFAAGHLVGARNLPLDQLGKAGDTLKKYKEKPVVVYCDTGANSGPAARKLAEQGFTKAVNLRGGIEAWRAENLPVTRS
jgi:rhodanese-related sulfurtransferase